MPRCYRIRAPVKTKGRARLNLRINQQNKVYMEPDYHDAVIMIKNRVNVHNK